MNLSELRGLYEMFEGNREVVEQALESIGKGQVTADEIVSDSYLVYCGEFYSEDDYVVDYDGDVISREDSFYCEGRQAYYHTDEMVVVYVGSGNEEYYSRNYAEGNFWEYDDRFYNDDGLNYHELTRVEDSEYIYHIDNVYYNDSDGCYYTEPQDREEYVRGYHSGDYKTYHFDTKIKSKYSIGYEIEKEDREVLESIEINDFEEETEYKWRKERDGSLADEGYELISPTFELNVSKIFKHIRGNETLVKHINARISTRCGGHIHLSEKGLSGEELFDKLKGYTPLFYALYYGRVNKNYCKGKNNRDLKNENEKYQAIKIHHNRIEFRIISAVTSVDTLEWRTKLLLMMLRHPTGDIIQAYYNVDTKFTSLLKKVYSQERLLELKDRFIGFTRQFEGLHIDKDIKE